jgi:hypothetical protein
MGRFVLLVVLLAAPAAAQTLGQRPPSPAPPPPPTGQKANTDPTYQQLRHITLGSESVSVNNLVLKRDAGTFTFRSGTFTFLAPVNGKVTGAVFVGDGSFSMVPPIATDKASLALLTKAPRMDEDFSELVLRFTDATDDEIRASGSAAGSPANGAAGLLDDSQSTLRKDLHYNLHARLLQDVLSPEPGGLFWAFLRGKRYSKKMLYVIDPHGVDVIRVMVPSLSSVVRGLPLAPEEVVLFTYDPEKQGVWASFHLAGEYASGKATSDQQNQFVHIQDQKLVTTIEKNARLSGDAFTTFQALPGGVRVVMFDLFPTLRVESVSDSAGQPLAFIQEDKYEDPDFAVILPKALAAGESFTVRTTYSGKDAVSNEGGGNYYPIARENWYPANPAGFFGDYATYEMTFRIPKGMTMVAAGAPLHEVNEGDQNISEWQSGTGQPVSGFNFGRFKKEETKLDKEGYVIDAYANLQEPDIVTEIHRLAEGRISGQPTPTGPSRPGIGGGPSGGGSAPVGSMTTTSLMEKALAEGQFSVQVYTDFFGPSIFHRLAMTQQTAGNYGQSWPDLVYLPITSFFDSTVRDLLGMSDPNGFFKEVGPHEVGHQWWGHTVGFSSYRDQWMSEGFAQFSASLVTQQAYGPEEYQKFWEVQHKRLTEKNVLGFRAIDVGPLTMGYRLSNSKSGFDITQRLIYPKGAYILQMLRMMMWTPRAGDKYFKEMMRDFVNTYRGRAATTEEFQAVVEKHMSSEMDLDHNHKMDWFFQPYVYGTALPNYNLTYSFDNGQRRGAMAGRRHHGGQQPGGGKGPPGRPQGQAQARRPQLLPRRAVYPELGSAAG